jgi:hypothetical protein
MKNIFSLKKQTAREKDKNIILVGFTVEDLDFFIRSLDQQAAKELSDATTREDQQGQIDVISKFKQISNMETYLKDRLEYHWNNQEE